MIALVRLVPTLLAAAVLVVVPAAPAQAATADVTVTATRIAAPTGSLKPFWLRVTATNHGPEAIPGPGSVWIDVDLPTGFQVESRPSCPFKIAGSEDLVCPIPSAGGFPMNQVASFDIGLRRESSAPVSITATFHAGTAPGTWTDPNPLDNSATLTGVYDAALNPSPDPSPGGGDGGETTCGIAYLKAYVKDTGLWGLQLASVIKRLKERGLKAFRERPRFDNVFTCPKGRFVGKVRTAPRRGRKVRLAAVDKTFSFCCMGRSTFRPKLTHAAKKLPPRTKRLRVRVTIRLFDAAGASTTAARTFTLRG